MNTPSSPKYFLSTIISRAIHLLQVLHSFILSYSICPHHYFLVPPKIEKSYTQNEKTIHFLYKSEWFPMWITYFSFSLFNSSGETVKPSPPNKRGFNSSSPDPSAKGTFAR